MLLKTLPRLQDNFENSVCCIRGHGQIGKRLEEAGIPVYYLELKNIFDFEVIRRFRRITKDFQPDTLVTYLIHADLFGRVFGRIFGIKKIICSVRVKLIQFKYLPLLFLDALTSPLVTHYHFNSKTVADMYQKIFFLPERKITIIPNGLEIEKYQISIDTNKKRQELNLSEDAIIIGCIGRLEKQKGQRYLIEAFSQIIKQYPSAILLVVGDGFERENLELLTKKLHLYNSVKFIGKRNDIAEILQIIDVFVLPSLYEGMSNAVMEAMASGLPIIATDIPENRELVKDKINGLLSEPRDSQALATMVGQLIFDKESAAILARNAQKTALQEFDITTITSRYNNLFSK